jgi:Cytochrome bd terminal oxidase subunit I
MNSNFSDPALWSRIQFGFTLTYHYLFPQLTMGLAWFLVYWKWRALRTGDEKYSQAARFWAKIFGLNFAVGVVTGIPTPLCSIPPATRFSRDRAAVVLARSVASRLWWHAGCGTPAPDGIGFRRILSCPDAYLMVFDSARHFD